MSNRVLIPTPLRPFTGKQDVVEVSGTTVGELLADLTRQFDGLKKHLYTDEGRLRSFVNIYVNDEDIGTCRRKGRRSRTAIPSASSLRSREEAAPPSTRSCRR